MNEKRFCALARLGLFLLVFAALALLLPLLPAWADNPIPASYSSGGTAHWGAEYTENVIGETGVTIDIGAFNSLTVYIHGTVTQNGPITVKSGTVSFIGAGEQSATVSNGSVTLPSIPDRLLRGGNTSVMEPYTNSSAFDMMVIEGGTVTLEKMVLDGNWVNTFGYHGIILKNASGSATPSLTIGTGTAVVNHFISAYYYSAPNKYASVDVERDGNKQAFCYGSAIHQLCGSIILDGGVIYNNWGITHGNIYLSGDGTSFTLKSGYVTENKLSTGSTGALVGGGGFYVADQATLVIDGGKISNNAPGRTNTGGGVYCDNGNLELNKNDTLTGNAAANDITRGKDIYLDHAGKFTVGENVTDISDINIKVVSAEVIVKNPNMNSLIWKDETGGVILTNGMIKWAKTDGNGILVIQNGHYVPTETAPEFTFDGTKKKPPIVVMAGDTVLTEGTHYTVTYPDDCIYAGTGRVDVTGIATYFDGNNQASSGTFIRNFQINPAQITQAQISLADLSAASIVYTGSEVIPAYQVKLGQVVLYNSATDAEAVFQRIFGNDSTVSGGTNAGSATLTITSQGNGSFTAGTTAAQYTIAPKSIADVIISGIEGKIYTGSAITQALTVTDPAVAAAGKQTLVEGKDYQIDYTNNVNAGTANFVITGIGNYTSQTQPTTFSITRRDISYVQIPDIAAHEYTGGPITLSPLPSVTDGTRTLAEGTDFTVTYNNNTNVGTGAQFIINGIGNYSGTNTKSFSITQKSITGDMIEAIPNQVYTGSNITPEPIVRDGNRVLAKGTDYTVTYQNSSNETANPQATGSYTAVINGKGNYTGTVNKTFQIVEQNIENVVTSYSISTNSYVYTGSPITPDVTVTSSSAAINKGTDYDVQYQNNVNVGDATIIVYGLGNYGGQISFPQAFAITAKDISCVTIGGVAGPYTYAGSPVITALTVTDTGVTGTGKRALEAGVDYTFQYKNTANDSTSTTPPSDAGSYTVIITGMGNYKSTTQKNFTITAKNIANTVISSGSASFSYNGNPHTPTLTVTDGSTLVEGTDYTVTYKNASGQNEDNPTAAGSYTAVITGQGNYGGSVEISFTIQPKSLTDGMVSGIGSTYTYTGSPVITALTVTDGSTLTKGTHYTVTYQNASGQIIDNPSAAGSYTAIITGQGNYGGSVTKSFSISPASLEYATVTVYPPNPTYQPAAAWPNSVSVSLSNSTVPESDYRVSYYVQGSNVPLSARPEAAGTYTVKVTGFGNYTGDKTASFTIARKSITGVSINVSDQTYTGSLPPLTVTDGAYTLSGVLDYVVEYKDANNNPVAAPVNAGSYTVTITGQGNYQEQISKTFTITAKNITSTMISGIQDKTYTGAAITQDTLTVKDGDVTLVKGTDYEAVYTNNVNAGTATVTITGKENYGSSAQADFTIQQKSISDSTIHFVFIPNAVASEQTYPDPIIMDYAIESSVGVYRRLINNTDYTYSENSSAGKGTVTFQGRGNYMGARNITYTIVQSSIASVITDFSPATGSYPYDATAHTPAVNLTTASSYTNNPADYEIVYENNINAGTASITIYGRGPYGGFVGPRTFLITARDISGVTVAPIPDQTYTGTEITLPQFPAVTDTEINHLLAVGVDYTVSYANNTNAGTATVIITGMGNYTGKKNSTFTITPADLSTATVTMTGAPYAYDPAQPWTPAVSVTLPPFGVLNSSAYTVQYFAAGSDTPLPEPPTTPGNYTVKVSGNGNCAGEKTADFTISPRNISIAGVSPSPIANQTHTGSEIKPAITMKDGTAVLTSGTDYDLSYSNNVNAGTATITITGKGFYTGTKTVTFQIVNSDSPSDPGTGGGESGGDNTGGGESGGDNTGGGESGGDNTGGGGAGGGGGGGGGGGNSSPTPSPSPSTGSSSDPSAAPDPAKPVNSGFDDVEETDWFYDAVSFVADAGLMNGTGDAVFSPELDLTRAMIATILYRMAEEPVFSAESFDDVPAGKYYSEAVAWAAENGVVRGYDTSRFGPEDGVTREQMAAMLYRYASLLGADTSGRGDLTGFTDAGSISEYARDAVGWAVFTGLLRGYGNGELMPRGLATRSEVAAILQRYCLWLGWKDAQTGAAETGT